LHDVLGLSQLHDAIVDVLDCCRTERHTPAPHGLGIRHPGAADPGEVAVHQVGAHLALEHAVAPVADVFEDQ